MGYFVLLHKPLEDLTIEELADNVIENLKLFKGHSETVVCKGFVNHPCDYLVTSFAKRAWDELYKRCSTEKRSGLKDD